VLLESLSDFVLHWFALTKLALPALVKAVIAVSRATLHRTFAND
jgi:hypothetical protein